MALHRSPDYQRSLCQLAFWFNIDFQDGSYVGFPIKMILATLDLQVNSILPMKFQVNCPFVSGEKVQNRFSIGLLGQPSWITDQNDQLFLIYKSSRYFLSDKFRVNGPFCSGEDVQNRFSRLAAILYFWSARFSQFLIYNHPDAFYQVKSQLAIWFRRSAK